MYIGTGYFIEILNKLKQQIIKCVFPCYLVFKIGAYEFRFKSFFVDNGIVSYPFITKVSLDLYKFCSGMN